MPHFSPMSWSFSCLCVFSLMLYFMSFIWWFQVFEFPFLFSSQVSNFLCLPKNKWNWE